MVRYGLHVTTHYIQFLVREKAEQTRLTLDGVSDVPSKRAIAARRVFV